jgi:hypothetical protein
VARLLSEHRFGHEAKSGIGDAVRPSYKGGLLRLEVLLRVEHPTRELAECMLGWRYVSGRRLWISEEVSRFLLSLRPEIEGGRWEVSKPEHHPLVGDARLWVMKRISR